MSTPDLDEFSTTTAVLRQTSATTLRREGGGRLVTIDTGPSEAARNALLLVHGWTCDSTSFDAQLRHFGAIRRVILPNLRGHGPNDAPVQGYALVDFVDDLRWQLDVLQVDRAIVVGHSMGGNVGLELAVREASRISGVLMIDSVLLPSPEADAAVRNIATLLDEIGLAATLERTSGLLFGDHDDSGLAAGIIKIMAATPYHVAVPALRSHVVDYDAGPTLAHCKVPLGYIAAANPLADISRVRELFPKLIAAQTLGAGHFSPIFAPDQVNAMIDRFMTIVEAEPVME